MVGKDTIRIESSDSNTDVRGDEGLGFIINLLNILSRLFL